MSNDFREGNRVAKALLIVNPASRRGARMVAEAERAFHKADVAVDVRLTEARGHGAELATGLGTLYDAVFTLGGDGTAIEVLGALAHKGPPVGILPGGTGNIVSRSLGTSARIPTAVHQLLHGEETRIDLGVLSTGERFAIGMGVGLDATMIANAPGPLKRRIGFFAYVVGASKAFFELEKFEVRLTVDGVTRDMRASAVLIANFGAVLNDWIAFGDGIQRDDGVLNVCVYSPGSVWDAARILWKMTRKDFSPDPCIYYSSGSSFMIDTTPARIGQADGELIGDSPFSVWVDPLAARVLVPRRN